MTASDLKSQNNEIMKIKTNKINFLWKFLKIEEARLK